MKTKDPNALDCRIAGRKGMVNLTQMAGIGSTREVTGDRENEEVCRLTFRHPADIDAQKLKDFLRWHAGQSVD